MVRSRNKYSRARIRAKVRRPKKRGGARWYYGALAAIVAAGTVGIMLSAGGSADVHPTATDHWHAAIGVNICGDWLSDPAEFTRRADTPNVYAGLHTHADGFIHVEVAVSSEAGNNATLGRFLEYGGWSVSDNSLSVWGGPSADPAKTVWTNGDECPPGSPNGGQQGVVKWSLDCKARSGDPNGYKIKDGAVVALAFLPDAVDIGVPPNATSAPVGEGGEQLSNLDVKACSTTTPGQETTTTSTTVPATTTP
jgi:hypothetical protein